LFFFPRALLFFRRGLLSRPRASVTVHAVLNRVPRASSEIMRV
jgi:hypothetical protein